MKTCSDCHADLPATTDHFAPRGSGLRGQCRQCKTAKDRQWRDSHADELTAYFRDYHEANRDRRLQQMAENYASDRESYRARERRWRAENPQAEAARRRRRRELLAAAEGDFSEEEWVHLRSTYGDCCLRCGSADGITPDHVVPLSHGGSNFITNIQPLCVSCNSAKGTHSTDYR